jgi:hypothetical protein
MPFGPECHHVRFDGHRCGSPALRGKVFCYYHARTRTAQQANIVVPEFDSPESAAYAARNLLNLMLNRKITVNEYRAAVSGMRNILTAISRFDKEKSSTVTDVSRHVVHEIASAGPDADPDEQPPETPSAQALPTEENASVGQSLSPGVPRSETPQLSSALKDPFIPGLGDLNSPDLHARRRILPSTKLPPSSDPDSLVAIPQDTYRRIIDNDEDYPRRTPDALRDYLEHEYRRRHGG